MLHPASCRDNPGIQSIVSSVDRRSKNRPARGCDRAAFGDTYIDGSEAWAGAPDPTDLAAEREALALARIGVIQPPMSERRLEAPLTRNCRYPRVASYRAHAKIEAHYRARLQGQPSAYRRDDEIVTKRDRARRALRRARRKRLLAELKQVKSQWLPFGVALKMCDIACRTLHKQTLAGRVRKVRTNGTVLVSVPDLRHWMQVKCAA